MKPKIDPEFRILIPPMTDEESRQLEENIVSDGCREPLIAWNGVLLDGHHRLQICKRHGLTYKVKKINFASREDAMLWIELNQLGRRNLSDDQRAAIGNSIRKRRAALQMKERAAKGGKAGGRHRPKVDRSNRSYVVAAKIARLSERRIRDVDEIERKLGLPAVERIRRGEIRTAT